MLTIFIGNLPKHVDKSELIEYLISKGYHDFSLKGKPKADRRYIVLQTKNELMYRRILKDNSLSLDGVKIRAQEYKEGSDRQKNDEFIKKKRVYVGGLPQHIKTDKGLCELFRCFGDIEHGYISQKCFQQKYKYGFITFRNVDDAQKLISLGSLKLENFEGKIQIKKFGKDPTPVKNKKNSNRSSFEQREENNAISMSHFSIRPNESRGLRKELIQTWRQEEQQPKEVYKQKRIFDIQNEGINYDSFSNNNSLNFNSKTFYHQLDDEQYLSQQPMDIHLQQQQQIQDQQQRSFMATNKNYLPLVPKKQFYHEKRPIRRPNPTDFVYSQISEEALSRSIFQVEWDQRLLSNVKLNHEGRNVRFR